MMDVGFNSNSAGKMHRFISRKEFFMINDVRENPKALRNIMDTYLRIESLAEKTCNKKKFFFLGCGSSYYAALFGVWPLASSGVQAYALPSSEFLFYYSGLMDEDSAVIGISRSGRTAETLLALRKARGNGAFTVSFTISPEAELSRECNESLFVDVGEERSIIMTKSFTALSLASMIFSANIRNILFKKEYPSIKVEELASSAEEILEKEQLMRDLAETRIRDGVERFVFLGSGPAYPISSEGALKIKETSYVASEALQTLEFRHGAASTIGEKQTIFLITCRGESLIASKKLFNEVMEKGGDIILLTDIQEDSEKVISIPYAGCEECASLLSIIPIQLFAYYYSVGRGRNPDEPRNLSRYVGSF